METRWISNAGGRTVGDEYQVSRFPLNQEESRVQVKEVRGHEINGTGSLIKL